ncbi:hypothetical protein G6011_03191 [Alternaria panax]|uniref:Uncharacterized protein n=1 Tax=Alternaria panax TaxID=48097 RepID=A0AAD4IEW0_9PLEO|nr:hypothetical protein G6011_03191 [Alternaria panax]
MTTPSSTGAFKGMQPSTYGQDSKKDAVTPVSKANEYADAEKNYNLKSLKFWLIVISIYLLFFLVALNLYDRCYSYTGIKKTYGSIADIGCHSSLRNRWHWSVRSLIRCGHDHRAPRFTAQATRLHFFFVLAFGVSSVSGLFVGGTFTDSATLTSRFRSYMNLPVGALAFAIVCFFLHLPSTPKEKLSVLVQLKRLDSVGLLFFAP